MSNNMKRFVISCLLCVTLLFNMSSVIEANIINAGTNSKSFVELNTKKRIYDDRSLLIGQLEAGKISVETGKKEEPAIEPKPSNDEQQVDETPINVEAKNAEYEVTAYYLNVRAEADASSKIISVVSKGTSLEVIRLVDNGWLELKSGGYINGSYAELISEAVNPSESEERNESSHAVVQAHQSPLIPESVIPKKPTSVVTSHSGLTEEHIAKIFKNTALEGEGLEKAILDIEKTYGINSYFTIAVMQLESGHGKSKLAQTKNNLFGLNALDGDSYNKALSFSSKGESVKEFGQIISEFYIKQGLTSVEKVADKYCGANSNWPVLVKSIMNSDYNKLS